jgi:hypothetical protein
MLTSCFDIKDLLIFLIEYIHVSQHSHNKQQEH